MVPVRRDPWANGRAAGPFILIDESAAARSGGVSELLQSQATARSYATDAPPASSAVFNPVPRKGRGDHGPGSGHGQTPDEARVGT